jgi:hypothetical protein
MTSKIETRKTATTVRLRVKRGRPDTLRPGAPLLREIVLHNDGTVEAHYVDNAASTRFSTLLAFLCEHSLHAQDVEVVEEADSESPA